MLPPPGIQNITSFCPTPLKNMLFTPYYFCLEMPEHGIRASFCSSTLPISCAVARTSSTLVDLNPLPLFRPDFEISGGFAPSQNEDILAPPPPPPPPWFCCAQIRAGNDSGGEELFALPLTEYPHLEKTKKVLSLWCAWYPPVRLPRKLSRCCNGHEREEAG